MPPSDYMSIISNLPRMARMPRMGAVRDPNCAPIRVIRGIRAIRGKLDLPDFDVALYTLAARLIQ